MIIDLQNRTHASAREVSESVGMGYRTLLRWRRRVSGGKPPLTPPGPKKTGPLPLEEVRREIEDCGTARSEAEASARSR